MLIQMKVAGLTIDPITNTPIVILKDMAENKALPIWIGLFEASAIATELEKIDFARPMTHDLLNLVIKGLDVTVSMVEINDLRDNTFFAVIHLLKNGVQVKIDSRPSDAIALALRADAPIFVDEKVIEKSKSVDLEKKTLNLDDVKKDKLKELLENLSPEAFGKYKM